MAPVETSKLVSRCIMTSALHHN